MMIFTGILILVTGILSYIILMICAKSKRKKITYIYSKTLVFIAAFVFTVETTNFFMLYHCSTFAFNYSISENKHTSEQLCKVAVYLIEKINFVSEEITRDEENHFVLTSDINIESKKAMQKLGEEYPSMKGYYPNPKPLTFSAVVTKLNLLGIYFPFSLEANYNNYMYSSDRPSTICHELAHLKGWIQEDEANFIAYLACINSENPEFEYSGYINAIEYLMSADNNLSIDDTIMLRTLLDDNAILDSRESHVVFREAQKSKVGEALSEVSDTAIEVSLKINGVSDGAKSYGRFVDLLLNYYLDGDGNIIEH